MKMNKIEAKKEIIKISQEMLDSKLNLISGCRIITGLTCNVDSPQDDIYLPFISVDSQTDHYPLGKVRELCDPDYLARIDIDIEDFIAFAGAHIRDSCRELINKLSGEDDSMKIA